MKVQKFSDAMGEIQERYLGEAMAYKRKPKKRSWVKWGAAAACLALVVYAGLRMLPQKSPDGGDALPMLTLTEDQGGGMGFEGYMAYNISELVDANPWKGTIGPATLPVYENPVTYDGSGRVLEPGPDFDRMRAFLLEIAARLGLDPDALAVTDDVPDAETRAIITEKFGGSVPEGYFDPTKLIARAEGVEIEVDPSMTATISFDPAVSLPEELHFTHHAYYEETLAVAQYLQTAYRDLIAMENPQVCIEGGDYDIYNRQGYRIAFFDGDGADAQRIVNYNFNQVTFACDDEGKLFLARVYRPDLSRKVGDYPLLTPEEAAGLLAEGHYSTSVPYEMPGREYVARVELIYRTGKHERYYLPYYRFFVEVPELERDGMKTYGAYYVPAVRPEYIANMPLWDGSFN